MLKKNGVKKDSYFDIESDNIDKKYNFHHFVETWRLVLNTRKLNYNLALQNIWQKKCSTFLCYDIAQYFSKKCQIKSYSKWYSNFMKGW